jgi:hypothetical protein
MTQYLRTSGLAATASTFSCFYCPKGAECVYDIAQGGQDAPRKGDPTGVPILPPHPGGGYNQQEISPPQDARNLTWSFFG